MYIKKYYPPIASTLIIGFLLGIFVVAGIEQKQYIVPFFMIILAFSVLHNKVVLYEDTIIIYRGFKTTRVDFDFVEGLEICDYRPMFSKVTMSTMFIKMKNSDVKKFYYSFYLRQTTKEIIEAALKRNNTITLDENIQTIIINGLPKNNSIRKKKIKETVGYTAIAIVILIYICLASK